MNYQEILGVLMDKMEVSEFAYHDIPGKQTGRGSIFIDGVGECVEVDQYGGEDKGEWWSVKYFPDHDVYIKVEGYYTSYDGTDFYDGWHGCCSEVKPKEKTIIVYSKV